MKKWQIRYDYLLLFLMLFAAFVDFYATFQHRNFYVLESNPFGSWILIVIKMLLPFIIFLFIKIANSDFARFFQVSFAIVLICSQTYAGYNNIKIKSYITNDIQAKYVEYQNTTIDDIPEKMIEPYVMEKQKATKQYFNLVGLFLYYPAFVANVTYFFHRKMKDEEI